MAPSLAPELQESTVRIGSGALGTVLRQEHRASLPAVEGLNLTEPEVVRRLHADYRDAGADILITNTFAANPIALQDAGLADQTAIINTTGVALARAAAGMAIPVWASIGPLDLGLRLDDFSSDQLRAAYAVQCQALRAADALLLETFREPREAEAALAEATATGLPVVFQIGRVGWGPSGLARFDSLCTLALQYRVATLGVNCCHPREALEMIRRLAGRTSRPITVAPNAGMPELVRGLVRYELDPAAFVVWAERLVEAGASLVGGCCGTTPAHIAALAQALRGRPVRRPPPSLAVQQSPSAAPPPAPSSTPPPHLIRDRILSDRFLISVEIRADRTRSLGTIVEEARRMAEAGADFFDVPDKPGASVGRDAGVVAARLQEQLGRPAIPHRAVVHANLLEAHSVLLGWWDLGLRGLLAVTGDSPSLGSLGGLARRVADLKSSVELLRLLRTLREGRTLSGETLDEPLDFCAGCAVGGTEPAHLEWLKKKKDAGAEFVFSQPVFEEDAWRRLQDRVEPLGLRLFPGLLPLLSRRSAETLAGGKIPGIRVPESVAAAFERYPDREDQRRHGLDQARRLAECIAREGRGLYLIVPFARSGAADAAHVIRGVRALIAA